MTARLAATLVQTDEDAQIQVLGHHCQAHAMQPSCMPASYMAVKHGLVCVLWMIRLSCS